MDWYSITIETKEEAVELLANKLYEIGIKGIEIVDNNLSQMEKDNLIVDYIDKDLLPMENIEIICYFSEEEDIEEKIKLIEEYLFSIKGLVDIGTGNITRKVTKEEDWANNWKQYYKTFRVGQHIIIKPTWEEAGDLLEDDIVIEIDPGMAFGCGSHETTSMCIEQIEKHLKKDDYLIDVGCGSGILSLVAGKLGASIVKAIDLDKAAVRVTKENILNNNLDNIISVYHGDLLDNIMDKGDIIVANIMADAILMIMDNIKLKLKTNGIFICSGIIQDRMNEIIIKLEKTGFDIIEISKKSEWVAITAKLN